MDSTENDTINPLTNEDSFVNVNPTIESNSDSSSDEDIQSNNEILPGGLQKNQVNIIGFNMRVRIIDFIGSGSFANVYTVYIIGENPNQYFALKISKNQLSEEEIARVFENNSILLREPHVNILAPITQGYYFNNQMYILYPKCTGTVAEYFSIPVNRTKEKLIKCLKHCLQGLQHLKNIGKIHYDLKPDNILTIDTTRGVMFVLSDIDGMRNSAFNTHIGPHDNIAGAPYFKAPQVMPNNLTDWSTGEVIHSTTNDMWSLGLTWYFLLFQTYPKIYRGLNINQLCNCIRNLKDSDINYDINELDESLRPDFDFLKSILREMLRTNKNERMTPSEMLLFMNRPEQTRINNRSIVHKEKIEKIMEKMIIFAKMFYEIGHIYKYINEHRGTTKEKLINAAGLSFYTTLFTGVVCPPLAGALVVNNVRTSFVDTTGHWKSLLKEVENFTTDARRVDNPRDLFELICDFKSTLYKKTGFWLTVEDPVRRIIIRDIRSSLDRIYPIYNRFNNEWIKDSDLKELNLPLNFHKMRRMSMERYKQIIDNWNNSHENGLRISTGRDSSYKKIKSIINSGVFDPKIKNEKFKYNWLVWYD